VTRSLAQQKVQRVAKLNDTLASLRALADPDSHELQCDGWSLREAQIDGRCVFFEATAFKFLKRVGLMKLVTGERAKQGLYLISVEGEVTLAMVDRVTRIDQEASRLADLAILHGTELADHDLIHTNLELLRELCEIRPRITKLERLLATADRRAAEKLRKHLDEVMLRHDTEAKSQPPP